MLYRFKSPTTADVIMLEPNARQLLQIMGKDESAPEGIVTNAQIPGAIAAIEAAIAQQEGGKPQADEDEDNQKGDGVGLRQRAVPMLDMLRRTHADGKDVVWGR